MLNAKLIAKGYKAGYHAIKIKHNMIAALIEEDFNHQDLPPTRTLDLKAGVYYVQLGIISDGWTRVDCQIGDVVLSNEWFELLDTDLYPFPEKKKEQVIPDRIED